MADICKCMNEECPARKTCYRYTAKAGYWQVYSDFRPDPKDGVCLDFMPIYDKEKINVVNSLDIL